MLNSNKETNSDLNIFHLLNFIKGKRKTIYVMNAIVFVVSIMWLFLIRNEYKASIELLPERSDSGSLSSLGGLGGLASLSGLKLPSQSSNVIPIELIPDLVSSKTFLYDILDDSIQYENGMVPIKSYFLSDHRKDVFERAIGFLFKSLGDFVERFSSKKEVVLPINPNILVINEEDNDAIQWIAGLVEVNLNLETEIVEISSKLRYRESAASLNYLISEKVSEFMSNYKTQKSKRSIGFLMDIKSTRDSILQVREEVLISFLESNQYIVSSESEFQRTELRGNYLSAKNWKDEIDKQLEIAMIDSQKKELFFKELKGIVLPIKKDSPKRIISLFAILFSLNLLFLFWCIVNFIFEKKNGPILL